MTESLAGRVAAGLAAPVGHEVTVFAAHLAQLSGAQAVLFYGSNLRTRSLDGVLDFYALCAGPVERHAIWPRVSYHEWEHGGQTLRAKLATMNLATFAAAASGELLDTTIWARFCQPSALVWFRGAETALRVAGAVAAAAMTAGRLAVALGPRTGTPEDYWKALFRATYKAELRMERSGREDHILAVNQGHFADLLPLALDAAGIACDVRGDSLAPAMDEKTRATVLGWWRKRQRLGRPYNILRLLKASTTFDGAARYAAWKIERHTGVPVQLTPWQERHPVLAAPGVLWRVWRAQGS